LFNTNVTVVNSAAGGRSIRSWLYTTLATSSGTWGSGECDVEVDASGKPIAQARWQAMLDGMAAGDYLFIQFGINDTVGSCGDAKYSGRHVGEAAFKAAHGMMAEAAKARGAQPIFVTPPSNISCSGSTAVNGRGNWPSYVIAAGATYGVPVIDLNKLTTSLYTSLKLCPNSADYTSTTSAVGIFFCADHTHFSDAGAPQVAKLIAQALKTQSIGLASYLL
jgi:lysophospholipase L1-like esterase